MAIEQVIQLSATGADATVTEINKTSGALNQVTSSSRGMEEQFGHRFQHIGLMLFAGDALRASGLGRETREVVSALNTAMIAGGAAFGSAAGPIMLVGSALAALAGIIIKVNQNHKEEFEAIQKQVDENGKSLTSINEQISGLERYRTAVGELTKGQDELLQSLIRVRDETQNKQNTAYEKQLISLNQIKASQEDEMTRLKQLASAQDATAASMAKNTGAMAEYYGKGEQAAKASEDNRKALQLLIVAHDQTVLSIKRIEDEMTRMHTGAHKTYDEMGKDAESAAARAKKAVEDQMRADIDAIHDQEAADRQSMDNRVNAWIQMEQAKIKESKKQADEEQRTAKQVADQIGNDFGSAVAKMIVEGQSFAESMQQAFTRMAEQVIQDIIRIEVEWAILSAMGFGGGGLGGGMLFGGFHAGGGTVVANQPTMAIFGESGPEIASFTPVGSASSSGGGVGTSIGAVNLTLNVQSIDGNDPAGTLDKLSDEIRRETASGRRFASTVSGVAGRHAGQAY